MCLLQVVSTVTLLLKYSLVVDDGLWGDVEDGLSWSLCGDVEENPGAEPTSNQIFSICHWNLNSVSAHNYIKLSLLRVYLSTHRFYVICLSETNLHSDTIHEKSNLEIVGYTLIRADHPSNTKRGGACLYYRNSLAFRLLNIQYLEECINFEISFADKVHNFISLYRSPNQ